jgi:single-strand DNA-binding protein
MASDTNKVITIGRLTRDPELRSLASGTSLADLSIAVNSTQKNKSTEEWEDCANFFSVTVFGKQAETIVKYCSKGDRICVTGRLEQRRWEAENGGKREKVGIVADSVQFLTTKGERTQQESPAQAAQSGEEAPF